MYFNSYVTRCDDTLCEYHISKNIKSLHCLDCFDDYLQCKFEEELFSMDNNGY